MAADLNVIILGLSLSSSWGNGHATTYRHLVKALHRRGHRVLFLERDVPWYAENRDLEHPEFGQLQLYSNLAELQDEYGVPIRDADLVIIGSFVPDGIAVARWVTQHARGITAFYDIDTPVTLAKLAEKQCDYLAPELVSEFDLYMSFTGGPVLKLLETRFGARHARPLYCAVDPDEYAPADVQPQYDLGYMGTYSEDRQMALDLLLLEPARQWPEGRFAVAGPQYPAEIDWPKNVRRIEHLPPAEHAAFYQSQRFTLNATRAAMVRLGYSPSIRLFEAAACGVPIISDPWPGLELFFDIGSELLVASATDEMLEILRMTSDEQRLKIGYGARQRVLREHTSDHRARQLEEYVDEIRSEQRRGGVRAGAHRRETVPLPQA